MEGEKEGISVRRKAKEKAEHMVVDTRIEAKGVMRAEGQEVITWIRGAERIPVDEAAGMVIDRLALRAGIPEVE